MCCYLLRSVSMIQKMLLSLRLSLLTIFTTEMWSYRLGHKQTSSFTRIADPRVDCALYTCEDPG